jgi:hypothetical protein
MNREKKEALMQVSPTAKLLLDVYLDCRILAEEHLTMKALVMTKIRWNREHQENFHFALEELIDKGYLTKGNTGVVLTGDGYDFLHKGQAGKRK